MLTHAEVIAGNRAGLEPTPCPGSLVLLGTAPDPVMVDGSVVYRTIDIYRCDRCEWFVSIDRETCKAIGSYEDPRPWCAMMVARLAGLYSARPHLPAETPE
jgi:hypothetical protein